LCGEPDKETTPANVAGDHGIHGLGACVDSVPNLEFEGQVAVEADGSMVQLCAAAVRFTSGVLEVLPTHISFIPRDTKRRPRELDDSTGVTRLNIAKGEPI
jgi:hypothetical protein